MKPISLQTNTLLTTFLSLKCRLNKNNNRYMKNKIIKILKYLVYLALALLALRILIFILAMYRLTHRPFQFDQAYKTDDVVFLYSTKFAQLTGLDPTKAIELPKGVQAIQFEANRPMDSEDTRYPAREFKIRNEYEAAWIDKRYGLINDLFPGRLQRTYFLECTFDLYLDDDIDLMFPLDKEYYGILLHPLLTRYPDSLPDQIEAIRVKNLPPGAPWYSNDFSSDFESDTREKIFFLSQASVDIAEKKVKLSEEQRKKLHGKGGRVHSLSYDFYKKEILPGINYLKTAPSASRLCLDIKDVKNNPSLFLEYKNKTYYHEEDEKEYADTFIPSDFFYFKLPKEMVNNPLYKKYENYQQKG